jgi:hypothetical protein
MAAARLKVAILIVSTTASKDPSTDASQITLSDVLEKEGDGKWELVDTKIVSDVVTQIQRQIMLWADVAEGEGVINLIVTTGGTGFATADNTPEVGLFVTPCYFSSVNSDANCRAHGVLDARLFRFYCISKPPVSYTACWLRLSALHPVSRSSFPMNEVWPL